MINFKKNIYKLENDVIVPNCVKLLFFDYKGVGDITFSFTNCDNISDSYTFFDLPNSGGSYVTYDTSLAVPEMPCYKDGTITASIVNVKNYVTEPCPEL